MHLVFSTKHRERLISETIRPSLHAYMATVFKNLQCPVLVINSVEDHVHILFSLHRTVALSKVVEDVKKSSSKWIKSQSNDFSRFQWQAGYGAFSVSESNVPAVQQYITNQAEHHRKVSFQHEIRIFMRKHHIDFDERFVWD